MSILALSGPPPSPFTSCLFVFVAPLNVLVSARELLLLPSVGSTCTGLSLNETHTGPLLPEYSGAGGVACTYILTSSFSVERGQWYCETKTHSWTPGMQRCFVPAANPHRNPPTPHPLLAASLLADKHSESGNNRSETHL